VFSLQKALGLSPSTGKKKETQLGLLGPAADVTEKQEGNKTDV
jgi:hypothetical protein